MRGRGSARLDTRCEIWSVDLRRCGTALLDIEKVCPRLSTDDWARASRLADAARRDERVTAYVALRISIERVVGPGVRQRAFERLASGKPVLFGMPGDFSLSHIDGYALIAVVDKGSAGVDLEHVREVAIDADRKAAIEAAAARLAPQTPLPDQGDGRRFQQAWTRLEAVAKARGIGMARVLGEIGVVGQAWSARAGRHDGRDGSAGPGTGPVTVADLGVADLDLGTTVRVGAIAAAKHILPHPQVMVVPEDLSGFAP